MDKAFDGKLAAVLETLGASGAEGEVTKLPAPSGLKVPVVIAVGLGQVPAKDEAYDAEALRRAAGSAARALKGSKKAGFALPTEAAEDAGAVAEGALLGAYAFTAYQGGENKLAPKGAKSRGRSSRSARSPCSAPSRATRRSRPPPSAPSRSPRRSTAPAT